VERLWGETHTLHYKENPSENRVHFAFFGPPRNGRYEPQNAGPILKKPNRLSFTPKQDSRSPTGRHYILKSSRDPNINLHFFQSESCGDGSNPSSGPPDHRFGLPQFQTGTFQFVMGKMMVTLPMVVPFIIDPIIYTPYITWVFIGYTVVYPFLKRALWGGLKS